MHGNCWDVGDGNLLECNQNLVKPVDALNKFAHRFWAKSNQLFVCRCTATAQRVRGQGMAGIHWSKTKSQSGQERSTIKLLGGGLGLGFGLGVGWSGGGVGWDGSGVWVEKVVAHEILAQFVLPGHLKGIVFVFGLTQSLATSCHDNESHSYLRQIKKYFEMTMQTAK